MKFSLDEMFDHRMNLRRRDGENTIFPLTWAQAIVLDFARTTLQPLALDVLHEALDIYRPFVQKEACDSTIKKDCLFAYELYASMNNLVVPVEKKQGVLDFIEQEKKLANNPKASKSLDVFKTNVLNSVSTPTLIQSEISKVLEIDYCREIGITKCFVLSAFLTLSDDDCFLEMFEEIFPAVLEKNGGKNVFLMHHVIKNYNDSKQKRAETLLLMNEYLKINPEQPSLKLNLVTLKL